MNEQFEKIAEEAFKGELEKISKVKNLNTVQKLLKKLVDSTPMAIRGEKAVFRGSRPNDGIRKNDLKIMGAATLATAGAGVYGAKKLLDLVRNKD